MALKAATSSLKSLTKITEISGDADATSRSFGTTSIPLAVLVPAYEAEKCVQSLRSFPIEEIGTCAFMEMYACQVERLSLQAHASAREQAEDEYVVEAILTHDKLTPLIETLLAVETWRTHVLPILMIPDLANRNSLRCAFILHVETTILGLINLVLYKRHGCEALYAATAIALVDYSARCLVQLATPTCHNPMLQRQKEPMQLQFKELSISPSPECVLQQTLLDTQFATCVAAATTARYLSEFIDSLSLSAQARIVDTHDFLLLMIPLIEEPPWTRRRTIAVKGKQNEHKWEKLVNNKWETIPPSDLLQITKCEAQPWLTLYFLTCNNTCRERYGLNTYRKNQLLRIRRFLNEVMLDQLPVLVELRRYMDELSLMNVPDTSSSGSSSNSFLLQQMDTIRDGFLRGRDWNKVANTQRTNIFSQVTDATDEDLKRVVDQVYSVDGIESLVEEEYRDDTTTTSSLLLRPVEKVKLLFAQSSSNYSFAFEPTQSISIIQTAAGNFRRIKLVPIDSNALASFLVETETTVTAVVNFEVDSKYDNAFRDSSAGTITLSNKLLFSNNTNNKGKEWYQIGSIEEGIILQFAFLPTERSSTSSTKGSVGYSLKQLFLSVPEPSEGEENIHLRNKTDQ